MDQLRTALIALGEHESEGVLGVLLEHPAAWLETYRGFRGLTAQLVGLSCLVRATSQRRCVDDAEESLQSSVSALMTICTRARDAATLIGTDLPVFARAAASAGWSSSACAGRGSPACGAHARANTHSHGHCHCHCCGTVSGAATGDGAFPSKCRRRRGSSSSSGGSCPSSPARAGPPSPAGKRSGGGGILRRIGGGGGKAAAAAAAASAASSPGSASPPGSGSRSFSGHPPNLAGSGGSLDDAACSLIARIQDTILHDSEEEHLEQDRAYLAHRVERLREHVDAAAAAEPAVAATAATVASAATAAMASAAASLVQSEVLLAAVDARLAALSCGSGGGGGTCAAAGVTVVADGSNRGRAAVVSAASASASAAGLGLGQASDVRKRRGGMRWLPLCFVGA